MTVAIDTNVLVRFLVEDDAAQAVIARDVIAGPCLVTPTVLLEVEWVLRSFYRWPRDAIAASLADVLDLPTIVADPPNARWAIDRFRQGADFADMMHIVTASGASGFATFDRSIARDVGALSPVPIETLV